MQVDKECMVVSLCSEGVLSDQSGFLALMRLALGGGESGHP